MVGVGLLCRNFVDLWYNHKWEKKVESAYKQHISPKMTSEKKYIYQVFILLNTRKICEIGPHFQFTTSSLWRTSSEVGVDAIDPSEEGASEEGTLEEDNTLEKEESTLEGGTGLNHQKLTLPT